MDRIHRNLLEEKKVEYADKRKINHGIDSFIPKKRKENMATTKLSYIKCLVTGASSGIGKATCQVLTQQGATVIGTGRNEASLLLLKKEGGILDYIVADVTQLGECQRIVDTAVTLLDGCLTSVVNAAGVLQGGAIGSEQVHMANYHHNMICNTQAPFEIICYAIPYLKKQKEYYPSIVNVSSVNGKQSFGGCITYCMSKAAVDQMTRCASIDLAPYGIRVNAVNPGVIMETNLQITGGLSHDQYTKFLKRSMEQTHPIAPSLGRVGRPEEVGDLIAFLISDQAKFITGECIAIDGGRQNLGAR
jgi:NAD(P)-dependent dehydrogenase (short-subunit alcohol dehydrogenase family)